MLFGGVWVPDGPTPCRSYPEAWFDDSILRGRGNPERARALCSPCAFQEECLAAALLYERQTSHRYGIWGGTLPIERDVLDRSRLCTTPTARSNSEK